jgi:hypothetical protein
LQTIGHHFNQLFNQGWHHAALSCINTFSSLQINQYCTGLKCVSYSINQVKTQLHENIYRNVNENFSRLIDDSRVMIQVVMSFL